LRDLEKQREEKGTKEGREKEGKGQKEWGKHPKISALHTIGHYRGRK